MTCLPPNEGHIQELQGNVVLQRESFQVSGCDRLVFRLDQVGSSPGLIPFLALELLNLDSFGLTVVGMNSPIVALLNFVVFNTVMYCIYI